MSKGPTGRTWSTGSSRNLANERGYYTISASPWWADATQIAFTRRPYLQAAGGTVYVAALRNGTIRQIAGFAGGPATWSPDGTRLVFNVQRGCKIRVVSVDASSPFETLPLDGCDPAWRPAS